jgi:hypothetical protein
MADDAIAALAALPAGARRALPHLDGEWRFPSRSTFNAFGAFSATVRGCAEQKEFAGRYGYRLTPLGEAVKALMEAQAA